jgi:polar amino acid transport system substrate-binding protein
MNSRRAAVAVAVVVVCLASACSPIASHDAATRHAGQALALLGAAPTTTTVPSAPCTTNDDTARSLRPQGPLPVAGKMPTGSFMAQIEQRGYLKAGVDQNTLGFSYREANGQIEGFDINLLRQVALAIFGNPNAIRFYAVTTDERVPAVRQNTVDIVASAFSITCDRWQKVDFSTEYYAAHQSVLVRADSPIQHVSDLNDKTVCATKTSTSVDHIRKFAPRAKLDAVGLRTECLVHLQEGLADAISTDDTILYGLASQDRRDTRMLSDNLHQPERYGMAVNKAHPDFVRFVNAVLEQVRSDGRWTRFDQELGQQLGIPAESPPAPRYRS